jgi:hypothetical protein
MVEASGQSGGSTVLLTNPLIGTYQEVELTHNQVRAHREVSVDPIFPARRSAMVCFAVTLEAELLSNCERNWKFEGRSNRCRAFGYNVIFCGPKTFNSSIQ